MSSSEPRVTRRSALKLLTISAASVALAACARSDQGRPTAPSSPPSGGAAPDFSDRFAQFEAADEPNGDLSKVVWPAFVTRAVPEVKRLYEFQITNGELMRYMPCFCGCQWEDGHRNNRDCYVEAVNPDGSVVLDPMAPT